MIFRLLKWKCNENFTVLGLLHLDDGTDRSFLNAGNCCITSQNNEDIIWLLTLDCSLHIRLTTCQTQNYSVLVFIFYIRFIWLQGKCSNRLLRMRLTNKQDHCVLKYDTIYSDASEEPTASIHV